MFLPNENENKENDAASSFLKFDTKSDNFFNSLSNYSFHNVEFIRNHAIDNVKYYIRYQATCYCILYADT